MSEPLALEAATGRSGLLDADPLTVGTPERGEATLTHDAEFVALDEGLSTLRDGINLGIDALNHVGAGLRRLPEGSLEELLIMPLTGDYLTIGQNAAAVRQMRECLSTYAGNVARLSLAVDPRWGGEAATAYLLRLGGHALIARGAGELIAHGDVVFTEIAEYSERLAIEVEELVMELCERGRRLLTKLLSRVCGPIGAAAFATDFLLHGFDAVTDIIEDVQRVLEIIDFLLTVQGDVRTWVEEQRARLERLLEFADLFSEAARARALGSGV